MEQYNDSADAPDLRTRRYRGTIASPSAISSGDYLYRSNHEYWNGSSLIVGGTFAFDNTNNANRTQFAVSVTTDGTSADPNNASKTQFKIDGNDSGAITFNNAYKFPTSDGSADQVLQTDGSGNLSFATVSGGASSGCDWSPSSTNIVISDQAIANLTGSCTIAIGYYTLNSATTGSNIGIGARALENVTTGTSNIAIGNEALKTATGSCNLAIGHNAGCNITTGTNNILLGYNAQPSNGSATNEITLGDNNINLFRIPGLGSTDKQVLAYNSITGGFELSTVDASVVADGSVSNTEFQYLDGVTSNIQTQLDDKASKGFAIAMAIAL